MGSVGKLAPLSTIKAPQMVLTFPATGLVCLSDIIAPQGPIPVSKKTWWEGVLWGRFPRPVKFGAPVLVWRAEDIQAILAGLDPAIPADARAETPDLRKRPIYEARADLSTYVPPPANPPAMTTPALPIGTQARFIAAATAAARHGTPLNTLLTLRWSSLFSDNDVNWLRTMPVPERIDRLVERIRKWLAQRGLPPVYIWVREVAGPEAEHWHIALHLRPTLRQAFAAYVVDLTGEARLKGKTWAGRSEGEFARGEIGSWHLARDTHPERQGHFLAAYLGKGEPSQRPYRGVLRDNDRKPVRGQAFGGDQPDGKYDADQGMITGTACRGDRFFIAKALQQRAKAEAGAA